MEGQANLTALDLQIKKLRDASVASIRQMAQRPALAPRCPTVASRWAVKSTGL